jgi:hypothetical protein
VRYPLLVREPVHLRLSIALVAVFLATGIVLEGLYGLRRADWMDDPIRREFLRLGHAHGGLLGLLNLVLAWAMTRLGTPEGWAGRVRTAAWLGAGLVGLGFCGGGLFHGPTDPGPLVLLVPAGALMVLAALVAVAWLRGGQD